MTRLKTFLLTTALIAISVPMTACETIDSTMSDVTKTVSSWDLGLPDINLEGKNEPSALNGEEEEIPPLTVVKRSGEMESAQPEEQDLEMTEVHVSSGDMISITSDSDGNVVILNADNTPLVDENCPKITLVDELSALHQFENPDHPSPSTRISSVDLTTYKASCKEGTANIAIDLELMFDAKIGPRARVWETDKPSFAYPYFVAITTPNGNIVAKEVFAATVSFSDQVDSVTHTETLRQIIPLGGEFNKDYALLIGFQLTEGELAYNRALKGEAYTGTSNVAPISDAVSSSDTWQETPDQKDPAKETAKAKPMTVVPETKPPVPETAKGEVEPEIKAEPVPAPAPVTTEEPEPEPTAEAVAPEPAPADVAKELSDTIKQEMPSAAQIESKTQETVETITEDLSATAEDAEAQTLHTINQAPRADEGLVENTEEPAMPDNGLEPVPEKEGELVIDITAE